MTTPLVGIVIPSCREVRIPHLDDHDHLRWYVVSDKAGAVPIHHDNKLNVKYTTRLMVEWAERRQFGWGSDSIRSIGFLRAYQDGCDYILTTDDDCILPFDWAKSHLEALTTFHNPWFNTVPDQTTRGMPYLANNYPTAISHGLWDGVLDLDGRTQLSIPRTWYRHVDFWERIGFPFAQSAMNLGFRRDITPLMYFPPQGALEPFDRFADIWCGVLAQAVLRHSNLAAMNGGACVVHQRASNPYDNVRKEKPGQEVHEEFWGYVFSWEPKLGIDRLEAKYRSLAQHVGDFNPGKDKAVWREYFQRLAHNMQTWVDTLESM